MLHDEATVSCWRLTWTLFTSFNLWFRLRPLLSQFLTASVRLFAAENEPETLPDARLTQCYDRNYSSTQRVSQFAAADLSSGPHRRSGVGMWANGCWNEGKAEQGEADNAHQSNHQMWREGVSTYFWPHWGAGLQSAHSEGAKPGKYLAHQAAFKE